MTTRAMGRNTPLVFMARVYTLGQLCPILTVMALVGTCSWKYPSWAGIVYSGPADADYLSEYARRYRTVEIDQWFWTLPDPETARGYAASVPKDFLFTVKVPNAVTLTHFYRKKGEKELRANPSFLSVELFNDILARLSPLRDRIGMLMLQFEYLNRQKMGSREEFLSRLSDFFAALAPSISSGPPCAVETRNPAWIDAGWFEFLAERALANVFLQGYYMPPVPELYRRFGSLLQKATVVRLHGPDRQGIEKATGEQWDRIVSPKDEELAQVASMVKDMEGHGLTVFLNVNNHYEGSAPLTIERLAALGVSAGARPPVEGTASPPQ
jgi:uncharacterized protein YecE (DUF72 family)